MGLGRSAVRAIPVKGYLASVIVAIAHLVTLCLGRRRGTEARIIASERLTAISVIATGRGRLLVHAQTRLAFRHARRLFHLEADTIEWIDAIPDGSCFWDIGANIGLFSLYAGLRPPIRVLAIEPSGSNFAALNRNIEVNRMAERVRGYCIAFSGETKLDVLNMANTEAGHVMHGFGTETDQFGGTIPTKFRQGAVGFSIDDFVNTFSPPLPTHVKIDVDGIENDILRGGRRTLSASSVRSIIVEIEGDPESARIREIETLLTEMGFAARPAASPGLRNVIFDRSPG